MDSRAHDSCVRHCALADRARGIPDELVQHHVLVHGAVLRASVPRDPWRIEHSGRATTRAVRRRHFRWISRVWHPHASHWGILLAECSDDGSVRPRYCTDIFVPAGLAHMADVHLPDAARGGVWLDADDHPGGDDQRCRP